MTDVSFTTNATFIRKARVGEKKKEMIKKLVVLVREESNNGILHMSELPFVANNLAKGFISASLRHYWLDKTSEEMALMLQHGDWMLTKKFKLEPLPVELLTKEFQEKKDIVKIRARLFNKLVNMVKSHLIVNQDSLVDVGRIDLNNPEVVLQYAEIAEITEEEAKAILYLRQREIDTQRIFLHAKIYKLSKEINMIVKEDQEASMEERLRQELIYNAAIG